MFVMTAKLSKPKLMAAGVVLVAVIAAIVMLLKGTGGSVPSLPTGDSNEARAAYLATYGWTIDAIPKETQTVTIPDPEENAVFARYNELQINQGFDLLPYKGREVTRFVYEILNYPEATAPVYAGVLVYEGKIIGGEITDTSPNGVIHGFQKPGTVTGSGTNEPATEEPTAETTTTPEEGNEEESSVAPADPSASSPSP